MTTIDGPVELMPGAEHNGLAAIMSGIIAQNLQDRPQLRSDFNQLVGRVAVVAHDVGVSLTLHFQGSQLQVFDGVVGMPDLTLVTDSELLLDLSRLERGPLGLPNLRGEHLRKIIRALLKGDIRIYGALQHPRFVQRLSNVLTIH